MHKHKKTYTKIFLEKGKENLGNTWAGIVWRFI